jgi:hypothetical protein
VKAEWHQDIGIPSLAHNQENFPCQLSVAGNVVEVVVVPVVSVVPVALVVLGLQDIAVAA